MATYTTNLNLKKPATSDKIRVADFNNNFDLIDAGYGDQDTSLGKLGGGMAVIATGNVHSAITAGQFVYVRKHSNLAEGLYTADSNISANGTLSTSNLSAVSGGGGLNVLRGEVNTINSVSGGDANIISTSKASHPITFPNSSRTFIIVTGNASVDRFWCGYIYCTASGGIRVQEVGKGSRASYEIPQDTTNVMNIVFDEAQPATIRAINLLGNAIYI